MMLCQRERIKKAFQSEGKEIRISSEAIPTNEREKSGKGDFIHYIWEVQANGMVYDDYTYKHETENKFARMTVKSDYYKIQLTGSLARAQTPRPFPPPIPTPTPTPTPSPSFSSHMMFPCCYDSRVADTLTSTWTRGSTRSSRPRPSARTR